jgi:integrase
VLPIIPELRAALEELPRPAENAYLFPIHAHCYDAGNTTVDPPFSAILRAVGLDNKLYSFHSWRHTLRTRLAAAGVATETAMRICGHTTAAMSRHYDHDDHLDEITAAIEKSR